MSRDQDDSPENEWSPEWQDEDEYSSEDDEESTVSCPHCRAEIHEDAQQCPVCGAYISAEDSQRSNYPPWVIATAIILLLAVIATYVF